MNIRPFIAAGVAAAALAVGAAPASATTFDRDCTEGSQSFCNGDILYYWKYTTVYTEYHRDHVCSGAKGSGGDVKSGSSCSTSSVDEWHATLTYNTPASYNYGVWVGNGSSINVHIRATD